MKSVLFLQNSVMAYRKPVYNALCAEYAVTVLHAGPKSVEPGDDYTEQIVPAHAIGPLFLQPGVSFERDIRPYDVVISMFDVRWPAYLWPLFRRERPTYLLWGHRYGANALSNRLRDLLMKRADGLIQYGDEEIERMVSRGIPREKIHVAPNTIHIPNHADLSGETKSSLLFVGRLEARKRVDDLIRAYARLEGRITDRVRLEIVGSGEEEPALRDLARELGVADDVVFHGRIDDDESLAPIFGRAFAYVSPGPIGLGVLHAFAYGVPVLTASNVRFGPEYQNIEPEGNALVFEDMEGMETAMRRITSEPELARRLGQAAHVHYSTSRTLESMVDGLREAIERCG